MVLIPSHSMRPITNSVSGDMPNITNYTEDDDTIFAPPGMELINLTCFFYIENKRLIFPGTISGTPRGMFRQDRLPTDPHGMSYLNTFDSQPGKQLNQSHITLAKQKQKHREISSPPLYWRENLVKFDFQTFNYYYLLLYLDI